MSLKIKKKKAVAPLAAATYIGICVGVIDLGTQYNEKFKKYTQKVMLIWEIPSETVEVDGEQKPRWQSKEYNATLNEKGNLAKDLTSWRGKSLTQEESEEGLDLQMMLGRCAMLSITVEEKDSGTYNRIGGIMGLPAGVPQPTTESELLSFDMDEWDDKVLEALPDWIREKIMRSSEYQEKHAPTDAVDFPEEQSDAAQSEQAAAEEEVPF